jgi:hypothetical protein
MKKVLRQGWQICGLAIAVLLGACSGERVEQSSDDFSAAADVLDDPKIIADTADIDTLLRENPRGLNRQLFETETVLRDNQKAASTSSVDESLEEGGSEALPRHAYYGDLHVHTTNSFDGYSMGTLATPFDAYRFARGEAIGNPAGFDMQLSRPMDFYAVTDHAMFLGLAKAAAETSTEFSKTTNQPVKAAIHLQ